MALLLLKLIVLNILEPVIKHGPDQLFLWCI